jgi:hypothetical protein
MALRQLYESIKPVVYSSRIRLDGSMFRARCAGSHEAVLKDGDGRTLPCNSGPKVQTVLMAMRRCIDVLEAPRRKAIPVVPGFGHR